DELKDFVINLRNIGVKSVSINIDNCTTIDFPKEKASRLTRLVQFGKTLGIDVGGAWYVPAMEIFTKLHSMDRFAFCSAASRVALFIKPNGDISFCDYHPRVIGHVDNLEEVFKLQDAINPYVFGKFRQCEGCEIEGFCSPCIMELEHLHRNNHAHFLNKCLFLKECFKNLLMDEIN
ncbi:hypothetical protein L9W80_15505, partial [Vibrio aestuarianus]|uniref:hypothetical protein n=1 Tax=Vibrio aestuarianus TaxID=28171 RepID=UPI00237D0A9F